MTDPLACMAQTLTGATPPPPTPAELTARRLARAAEVLRRSDDPDALTVAHAFEIWLNRGGDLRALLGAKARRGRRRDLPAHDRRARMRDIMVRSLADDLHEPGMTQRAHLARLVACLEDPAVVRIFRETVGVDEVPRSHTRLRAILRAA